MATTAPPRPTAHATYDAPMSGDLPQDDPNDPYWTLADITAHFGWAADTARTLHNRAAFNRRNNTVRPGDMDPPDHVFGRSPVWRKSTILAYEARRPGPGRPKSNS